MARANDQVAALLSEYAELLTMTGGDRFKIRSYEKAARAVRGHHADLATLDDKGVRSIPGVGASIAGKVVEAQRDGTFAQLEELRAEVPDGVRALMAIPNLGPAKALAVHRELGISSVEELEAAIDEGKLRDLKGFGARTEEVIRGGIALMRSGGGRVLMSVALGIAEPMVARLAPLADKCAYAGSLRRGRETVGDIDILATAAESGPLMDAFVALPEVASVLLRGETKTSVRTGPVRGAPGGLQVDLRVVPVECWGAALQYFTGSKEHNVRVRELAVHAGLKLSEYGLFQVEQSGSFVAGRPAGERQTTPSGELIVADTEEKVYERLGLAWIPPTLREDTGEVAAARDGSLPRLVTVDDLRGDLHTHTDLTDGISSLTEMLDAAASRGYEYYVVTDHAPDLVMQRMTLEKALAQRQQLRALQDSYPTMRLLHGSELNIGPDGTVDWDADVLSGFDVCVASVHSHFTLPVAEQTRRLIRACENPHVHVIGHLTGRRLGRRPPVEVDLDAVFEAAAATGTAIEVNGGPERLDLRDEHIRWARRHGVRFSIDSDAHAVPELGYVRYATLTAQRGWLTPDDVINTWPYDRFRAFIDGE